MSQPGTANGSPLPDKFKRLGPNASIRTERIRAGTASAVHLAAAGRVGAGHAEEHALLACAVSRAGDGHDPHSCVRSSCRSDGAARDCPVLINAILPQP